PLYYAEGVDVYKKQVQKKQKPAEAGFYVNQVKLTDKPLSFGYSVVDSHSSFCPSKSKNPPKRVFT
ncbi:hypothetical protein AP220_18970, partial [Escherichia coli]|uniref:hypothetical protein n=1 Tax=Escherichia coli TaxID=562 RepID=UPI0008FF3CDD